MSIIFLFTKRSLGISNIILHYSFQKPLIGSLSLREPSRIQQLLDMTQSYADLIVLYSLSHEYQCIPAPWLERKCLASWFMKNITLFSFTAVPFFSVISSNPKFRAVNRKQLTGLALEKSLFNWTNTHGMRPISRGTLSVRHKESDGLKKEKIWKPISVSFTSGRPLVPKNSSPKDRFLNCNKPFFDISEHFLSQGSQPAFT